ncbi:MAG: peptidoglycan-binding domain-containing protein [Candidatus Omnitrophota bacterium]
MRKFVVMVLCLGVAVCVVGCRKKQLSLEEMQEPMSMEALSKMPAEQQSIEMQAQATTTEAPKQAEIGVVAPVQVTPAAKPTNEEIQIALKNAGFYTGEIDGKVGPMTRRATEEFQKANNLKVDGKVGTQTWGLLSPYLNPPADTKVKKKR